jgi:hypothetical protein
MVQSKEVPCLVYGGVALSKLNLLLVCEAWLGSRYSCPIIPYTVLQIPLRVLIGEGGNTIEANTKHV